MNSLLITGVTGTLGRALLRHCCADARWARIVGFSRDEWKQSQVAAEFGSDGPLRLFLGDVRDAARLALAFRGVDVVVHAAALKRIDAGTYSPSEMIATNILGTLNVVNAAIQAGVRRVVVVSSDKSVCATNLYGSTKFCAESYAVQANSYGYPTGTLVAAVRYGNVLGSRGSVVNRWREQAAAGLPLDLTDERMTRFIMTIQQAVTLVLFAVDRMRGGEVFVPLLRSARMADLAHAVAPDSPIVPVGLRPGGEKIAETLINGEEMYRTRRVSDDYFAIVPSYHAWTDGDPWGGTAVDPAGVYQSDTVELLSVEELRLLTDKLEAV